MRAIISLAALCVVVYSIATDFSTPVPGSILCRAGLCRFDQIYQGIDATGDRPDALAALVDEDSSNPLVWSSYGEALAREGQEQAAGDAFERAAALGSGMPAIQIRAANFFFTHGNARRAAELSGRAVARTATYDGLVFSYFRPSRATAEAWLGKAIPATPRAARAWMMWLRDNGSDEEVRESWEWARSRGLVGQEAAADLAFGLWRRRMYGAARDVWSEWTRGGPGDQLLADAAFADAPAGGPFEWTLGARPGVVEVSRENGLAIRFSGRENVGFWDVREATMTHGAGVYRLAAEIESEDLTTDQGPYFHIVDPARPEMVHAETRQIRGSTPRSWIATAITVPFSTEALEVIVERQPSLQILNRISGTLRIFRISLVPRG